ncbi:carboxy terminal-processing peptidase [Psychrilyobacter atlanticus]|uniref:carboxy terminal-processing peptidase n=1 Tax=Psychrilyobacter atlanticus TaxID=271091 RepID=UPI000427A95F|nr:carboxy terminal-processing peptidase [Psychrilyobacter atlanticus]
MKIYRKITVLIGILLIAIVSVAKVDTEKKEQMNRVLSDISFSLETTHYKDLDIDDQFSKNVLKNYLDTLDYNHQYFTQAEVDEIYKKWGKQLDDDFLNGNSRAAFEIYDIYKEAVERVNKYQTKLLENPKNLDFTLDEKLVYDREEEPYFVTKEEYESHWKKMLKSSILSLEDYEELTYEKSIDRMKSRMETRQKLLEKKTTDDIYSYFVNAFLKEYDPHTTYLSAKEIADFNISMKLQLSGIGAVLTGEKGVIKVVKIMPDGPAAKGKELQPEDKIIAVATDGKAFEDIMDWPLGDAVNLIRGKEGTTVKLKVIPSGSKTAKEYTFVRENVKLEDRGARYFIKEAKSKNSNYKIGVINLPSFYMDFDAYSKGDKDYKSTTRDVKKIIEKLNKENIDGLIIDLRNNGGGSLSEVNNLMGLFIPYGPVVQVKEGGRVSYLGDSDMTTYFDKPVIVMVNRLSASASEIFAAAMQDYGRGIIVGTPTFGKGTVQTIKQLDLGELKYTNGKFYRIDGGSTQHKGVTPDILFPPTYDSAEIGESSLDNPLPWDEVESLINGENSKNNIKLKEYLTKKHNERIANNPDFIYNVKRYGIIEEITKDKEVSLNRAVRKMETKELEDKWLAITNEKMKGKNEPQLKDYKALEDYNKGRAKKDELELLKKDGEIIETVKILADELAIGRKK